MRTVVLLSAALFTALTLHALPPGGNVEPVTPVKGQRASGPYTPGVLTADYLYVSSQGPRSAGGSMPATIGAQVDQCVENLKAVIEAAGLTMDHVVYTHVYLDDISLYDGMNRAYAKHFGDIPPARAVVGIAKRSNGMHVTMNAVAVRNLSMKKAVSIPGVTIDEPYSPGILTHDRMFISGILGRDLATGEIPDSVAAQVKMALDNVGKVLKAGGLGYQHVVFTNPYVGPGVAYGEMNKVYAGYFEFGNTPARATILVTSLPHKTRIEYTAVAVRDLSQRLAVRPTESRIIPRQSKQREDCFQKAAIKRGLRRMRRSAWRARWSSSQ